MRWFLARKPGPTLLRILLLIVIGGLAIQSVVSQQRPATGSITDEFPKTDFTRAIISADEIISGGPPRDGIPALDREKIARSRRVPSLNAFDRRLDDRVLTFEMREGEIFDIETGSRWTPLGQAVEGPLAGERLAGLPGGVHFAFAWLAFRPDTSIYGQ